MKTNYLLMVLMAAGIICSCEREAEISEIASSQPGNSTEVIIHATMAQEGGTKTILQEDGAVFWQPEDQIAVFFNTVRVPFTAFNSVDAASAYFVGNTDLATGHNENSDGNLAGEYVYWGLYPLNASSFSERYNTSEFYFDNNLLWAYLMQRNGDFTSEYGKNNFIFTPSYCSGKEVSTILYDWQKGVENTFDTQLNIALAKSDDYHELAFYNVLGGVRFMLQSSDITRVTFKGNGGEALAGKFSVTMDDNGKPLITEVSIPSETITVSLENDKAFKPGVWYYAMMFPGTLSKGYTMEFYTSNSSAKKVVTSSVEVKRSVFGSLENPDKDLSYEPIAYASSLNLDVSSLSLKVGQSWQLVANVSPSDCTFPVVWKSANPEIVSVDENGKLTAIAYGSSEIYALCDRSMSTVYVQVGDTSSGTPSFEIISADLSGADALALMQENNPDSQTGEYAYSIHKIDSEGNPTPLRFTFSCADDGTEQQLNENARVTGSMHWMTDQFLVINDARVYCKGVTVEYGKEYGDYLEQSGHCFAIRLSDNKVFLIKDDDSNKYRTWRFDERLNDHWHYQKLHGIFRWSYDGTRLYSFGRSNDYPFFWFTLSNGSLDAQSNLDFSTSPFGVESGSIILDKNNNLVGQYYDTYYVFFDDGGMAEIPLPEDYDYYYSKIIENNYNWYLFCSNYEKLAVYQIIVSGHEVSVTQVAMSTDVGNSNFGILQNDDVIVLIDSPVIVTFNPETNELTKTSLDEAFPNVDLYGRTYDAYGICYELSDGVLTKYDLVNQTIETIVTDRSNVPQMTPTSPTYDSANNCFFETGTRYSDTKTITVVTDCSTGKVTVYEGAYESNFIYYLRLS